MQTHPCLAIAVLIGLSAATPAGAEPAASAPSAAPVPRSGPILDVRLRNESVADDAFANSADATTLRLRLGYRTPVISGWSGLIEIENTSHLFGERYNSSANHRTAYPTVADPDNTEINQAYVQYAPSAATRVTLGRQRLVYDNQRFFGNVGWRQNEQTFDALDMEHRFDNGLALRYSYLDRVQRVFGADNPTPSLARWMLNAHLLRASHALGPGTLVGYAHFIDNRTLPLTSHRNLGLRYTAKHDAKDGVGWLASLEYASQHPYADGSRLIDADYAFAEGGLVWRSNTFKAGWERMGGNGRYAFQTPFATLHAFDGWADRFLTTPANGLRDGYLSWNRGFGKLSATVVWHDFQSTHGSIHYGREWDASLGWAFAPHWNALAKVADYHAADVGVDVAKTWISVEYSY
jgi:hypothetical protein